MTESTKTSEYVYGQYEEDWRDENDILHRLDGPARTTKTDQGWITLEWYNRGRPVRYERQLPDGSGSIAVFDENGVQIWSIWTHSDGRTIIQSQSEIDLESQSV